MLWVPQTDARSLSSTIGTFEAERNHLSVTPAWEMCCDGSPVSWVASGG
jgi:hypothetical protein